MNTRHKRALRATLIVALVCAGPMWFFYRESRKSVVPDVKRFGMVPDFVLNFVNQPVGLTSFDTQKHITLVAVLKDSCAQDCPETVKFLQQLKTWADAELRLHSAKITQPQPIRFVIQTQGATETLPQDWSIASMADDDVYLVPEPKKDAPVPAVVLIDDSGFYRAYQPLAEAGAETLLKQELTRMITQQYLLHYVAEQTLMWEKSKPRRSLKD